MLNRLKIFGRLSIGFGTLLFFILIMCGWGAISGARTSSAVSEANRQAAVVITAKDALLTVRQARVLTWEFVATGSDAALKGSEDSFAEFRKLDGAVVSRTVNPVGRQLAKDFSDSVQSFEASAKVMVELRRKGAAIGSPEFVTAISQFDSAAKGYVAANRLRKKAA
jgi:CHASE3 domain sensor protein